MNENEMVKARWSRLRAAHKADLPALTVARAREFLREYPDCGPAWKILGEALVDLARHSEAEHALKQAIAKCPPTSSGFPLPRWAICTGPGASTRLRSPGIGERSTRCPTKPADISTSAVSWPSLADSKRQKRPIGRPSAAPRAAGTRPTSTLAWFLRARERYDEAATCFEQALKLDPKYVAARKALRDVRNTMRFSKELRREMAAMPASKLATAESRSASVAAEPVAS